MPGGESKRVTDKNKKEFVEKATRRRALGGAEQAISAIRSGMGDVIPKNLLSILLPPEVRFASMSERAALIVARLGRWLDKIAPALWTEPAGFTTGGCGRLGM